MTHDEATTGLSILRAAPWHAGLKRQLWMTEPTPGNYHVHVSVSAGDGRWHRYTAQRPVTFATVERALAWADAVFHEAVEQATTDRAHAAGGGGRVNLPVASDAEYHEPQPDWLRVSLARIGAETTACEGARRLAVEVVRCLEFDGIPAPQVYTIDNALVMRWENGSRELEAACFGRSHLVLSHLGGVTTPFTNQFLCDDLQSRQRAWFWCRLSVQWVNNRKAIRRDEIDELCYVRRAG